MTGMTLVPNRRWLQFRLRTLFVGITVVAAALGLWLGYIAPAERQRASVRGVEELGGKIRYADAPVGELWPVTELREWLPRDYFDAVEAVDLYGHHRLVDADLRHLEGLAQLHELRLGHSHLTDAGLVHLRELRQLRELYLNRTRVTDSGLVHLQGLKNLQKLNLSYTRVTDAGAEEFQRASPGCEITR